MVAGGSGLRRRWGGDQAPPLPGEREAIEEGVAVSVVVEALVETASHEATGGADREGEGGFPHPKAGRSFDGGGHSGRGGAGGGEVDGGPGGVMGVTIVNSCQTGRALSLIDVDPVLFYAYCTEGGLRPAAKATAQQSARKTTRKKHCGGDGGHARPASRRPLLRCQYRVFLKMGHQKVRETSRRSCQRRGCWHDAVHPPCGSTRTARRGRKRWPTVVDGRPAGLVPVAPMVLCAYSRRQHHNGAPQPPALNTATAAACTSPLRFMDGKNRDFLQPR